MHEFGIRAYLRVQQFVREQRGSGIIDYVAVGFVVLALMGAVAAAMTGKGGDLADKVIAAIGKVLDKF